MTSIRVRLSIASLVACFGLTPVRAAEKLDFNRDVRPVLSEHCFACHGFDEKSRQADLRLDIADSVTSDRGGTVAIKPGKPEESEVWRRILSSDDDERMPPPKSHTTLTVKEKEIVRRWIEEGAPYAGHWSFIQPRKLDLPRDFSDLMAIDAWIRERLKEEGLQPSPEADRATLIRRLSFDLTGLPPTGEEVEAFQKDKSPLAYERVVDRLLASQHFGERISVEWLDAARYADTNGFSIDGGRHMWLWRDWVIQAFNDNLPYDEFLKQQLAGDLYPNADDGTRIATGFQRNNMVTHEGGTIPEENLTNYNADRVKTFGESILGLTLGCAQCHDHKFDPISQREYYQLFAFFNSLSDKGLDGNGGVNPGPSIQAKTVLKTKELSGLQQRIAEIKDRLSTADTAIQNAWEARELALNKKRGKELKTHSVRVIKVSTPNRGAGIEVEQERFIELTQPGAMGAFDVSTEMPKLDQPITAVRVIVHSVPSLPQGGWGYGAGDGQKPRPAPAKATKKGIKGQAIASEAAKSDAEETDTFKGTFRLTALAASVDKIPGDQINLFKLEPWRRVTANSWDVSHPPLGCLDPRNDDGWSPDLASEGSVHLTATLDQPIDSRSEPFLTVQLNFGSGQELIPQRVELQVLTGNDDGTDLPTSIVEILSKGSVDRSEEERQQIWKYCAEHCDELLEQRIELANLEERETVLTKTFTTMVMDVAAKPRETFILNRGDYTQPTQAVSMGTMKCLPPMPEQSPSNRLGLAEWVVSQEHPLTARVAVNRFWKMLFGMGIVGTAADFGSQGEWPSHPELLDWLAVDFVESGWDVKRLIKQMVLSETYRQRSSTTAELVERDPQNRLYARGARFRLPAEFIRDAALKTSGLLVPRIGGPSVNPYTPGDLWREVSHYGSTPATAQTFVQDHGEKLYRRSLYTYWKRTAPPPSMVAFDAPNREVCTIARGNTTTPLQALVTLNDIQFVEASRAFATRILGQPMTSDKDRLAWAFREATSRDASGDELRILERTLIRERERYTRNVDAAHEFVTTGELSVPSSIPIAELAAWSQIGSLLLNLSESLTRS